jgi:hypothetical protein
MSAIESSDIPNYRGDVEFWRIPEAIATLGRKKKKVTDTSVAEYIGCTPQNLYAARQRHPRIAAAYDLAKVGVYIRLR